MAEQDAARASTSVASRAPAAVDGHDKSGPRIVVSGVARSKTGHRLRRAEVRMTLFGHRILLGKDRAGPRGGFDIAVNARRGWRSTRVVTTAS